jgi:hypothetical protein
MNRGRHDIVERVHCPGTSQKLGWSEVRKALELLSGFALKRSQEVSLIYPGEAAVDMPRRSSEIKGHRNGCCGADLRWNVSASLPEKLEEDVTPQGNTDEDQDLVGKLCEQAVDDKCEIGRLTGMVKAPGAIQLISAGAEDHHVGSPSATMCFSEQGLCVVRADGALETVEHEQTRSRGRRDGLKAVKVQKVAIGSIPALEHGLLLLLAPE